ncbi:hypothetical protein [Allorhodopirellula heiligendammensis]|uniref:Secreted protein n=1 Tax=Allorhodopirellula heiligendammensis TaxID=2714739 RepID=A0A5C6BXS6_9BACT|nr:hypothetical protein [Allorhodopirellula heiligendammensis]TWU16271.1 hypothetical protein Poly21_34760 [Allorhodopirellula heiligendammensis]
MRSTSLHMLFLAATAFMLFAPGCGSSSEPTIIEQPPVPEDQYDENGVELEKGV